MLRVHKPLTLAGSWGALACLSARRTARRRAGLAALAEAGACAGAQERAGGGEGGVLSVVERARLDRLRIVAEAEAREKAEAAALAEQVREPAVRLCAVPEQSCALACWHFRTQHITVAAVAAADGAAPGAGAGAAAATAGHAAARACQAGAPGRPSTCWCSGLSSQRVSDQAGTLRRCGCASRASGCARRVSHALHGRCHRPDHMITQSLLRLSAPVCGTGNQAHGGCAGVGP